MADKMITSADAAAYVALDNRGQPSVSPTERRMVEEARINRLAFLEKENVRLVEENRLLSIRIDDLILKSRGRS